MNLSPKHSMMMMLLATLTACEGSGDMPIQHADNYGNIGFAVQPEQMVSRTNPYEAYDPAKHPSTMGVYGFNDKTEPMFYNTEITYDTKTKTWDYVDKKRWDDYKGRKTFDFFAVMPRTEGTKLTDAKGNEVTAIATAKANSAYTLTLPISLTTADGKPAPLMYDVTKAPLICAQPDHKTGTDAEGNELTFERLVKFQFDQTLTGYKLLFKLDPKMGAIRQFRIKSVKIKGEVATSGSVSRTYTWDGSDWKAGNRIWSTQAMQYKDFGGGGDNGAEAFEIAYATPTQEDGQYDDEKKTLLVTSADFKLWGQPFYTIPDPQHFPTISVTYDVELTTEKGDQVATRKDITSDITLNKINFANLASGIAMMNPIRILIQPRYLYVLADDDAYSGHLLID